MKLRLIGDIHGQYDNHLELAGAADYSIQIGDYGFRYNWLYKLDVAKHRFFGGNHDNYDEITKSPYTLGDFGPVTHIPEMKDKMFFVRGAWSIDYRYRTKGIDWWSEEEMSQERCEEAIEAYADYKPDILLSHEGPFHLLPALCLNPAFAQSMGFSESLIKTRTNMMLDAMFTRHRPKLYVFGHYHKDFDFEMDGTRYVCITADRNMDRIKQRTFDIEL
jgi:predicted phosphodiesterase